MLRRSRQWTPEEDALLLAMAGSNASVLSIIARLRRPESTVRVRAAKLGRPLKTLSQMRLEQGLPKQGVWRQIYAER